MFGPVISISISPVLFPLIERAWARLEDTAEDLNIQFLGRVPLEPGVVRSGDSGMPVVISEPESKSAEAFNAIVQKIIRTVEKR